MARTVTTRQSVAQRQFAMDMSVPVPPRPVARAKLTPRYGGASELAVTALATIVEAPPADAEIDWVAL